MADCKETKIMKWFTYSQTYKKLRLGIHLRSGLDPTKLQFLRLLPAKGKKYISHLMKSFMQHMVHHLLFSPFDKEDMNSVNSMKAGGILSSKSP